MSSSVPRRALLAELASCSRRVVLRAQGVGVGARGDVGSGPGAAPTAPWSTLEFGGCWQTELEAK